MTRMMRTLGGVAGALLLGCASASAAEHLVPASAVESALAQAASRRSANVASVEKVLALPAARGAAARLGADTDRLRTALAVLSDDELDDLAVRARALDQQPTAGVTEDVNQLLVIFLIVAIVILVLKAVN